MADADIQILIEAVDRFTQTSQKILREMERMNTQARRGFDQTARASQGAARAIDGVSRSVSNAARGFGEFATRVALATGGFIAFNQFVNATATLLKSAIGSVEDFRAAAISTATIITSMTERKGPEEFAAALAYSTDMMTKLDMAAARFVATGQEMRLAFQAFAIRGVLPITDQDVDRLGQITDFIKFITAGQASSIQIQQEIRNLMEGQVRAGSILAQIIKERVGDLDKWVQKHREAGDLLQAITDMLPAVAVTQSEVQRLASTWANTLQTIWSIISRQAFTGVYDDIVRTLEHISSLYIDQQGQLTQLASDIVTKVQSAWEDKVKPAILSIFNWLRENGPRIIEGNIKAITDLVKLVRDAKTAWDAVAAVVENVVSSLKQGIDFLDTWVFHARQLRSLLHMVIPPPQLGGAPHVTDINKQYEEQLREQDRIVERLLRNRPIAPGGVTLPKITAGGGAGADEGSARRARQLVSDYVGELEKLRELEKISTEEQIQLLDTRARRLAEALKDERDRKQSILDIDLRIHRLRQRLFQEETDAIAKFNTWEREQWQKTADAKKITDEKAADDAERALEYEKDVIVRFNEWERAQADKAAAERNRQFEEAQRRMLQERDNRVRLAETQYALGQMTIDQLIAIHEALLQEETDLQRQFDLRLKIMGLIHQAAQLEEQRVLSVHQDIVNAEQAYLSLLEQQLELGEATVEQVNRQREELLKALRAQQAITEDRAEWLHLLLQINDVQYQIARSNAAQNLATGFRFAAEEFRRITTDWVAIGQQVVGGLTRAFSTLFSDIMKGAKSFGESLTDFFRTLIDDIIGLISQQFAVRVVKFFLPFLLGQGGIIGGGSIGALKLQQGGIFNRPTAIVAEGGQAEAVIPLPDNRNVPVKLLDERGSREVRVTSIVVFDPRQMPRTDPDQVVAVVAADITRGGVLREVVRRIR